MLRPLREFSSRGSVSVLFLNPPLRHAGLLLAALAHHETAGDERLDQVFRLELRAIQLVDERISQHRPPLDKTDHHLAAAPPQLASDCSEIDLLQLQFVRHARS